MRARLISLLSSVRGRVVLGSFGVISLAAGIWAAIDTKAATPLLIVGAVLAIVALLDWEELNLSHGETGLRVTRAVEARIEGVLEHEELPEDVRTELEEVRDGLAAVGDSLNRAAEKVPEYSTRHRRLGPGIVELTLKSNTLHLFERLSIEVEHTATRRSWAQRIVRTQSFWNNAIIVFPTEFDDSDPGRPPPGDYYVTWSVTNVVLPNMLRRAAIDKFSVDASEYDST